MILFSLSGATAAGGLRTYGIYFDVGTGKDLLYLRVTKVFSSDGDYGTFLDGWTVVTPHDLCSLDLGPGRTVVYVPSAGVVLDARHQVLSTSVQVDTSTPVVADRTLLPACASGGEFSQLSITPQAAVGGPMPPGRTVTIDSNSPYLIAGPVREVLDPVGGSTYFIDVGSDRCGPDAREVVATTRRAPRSWRRLHPSATRGVRTPETRPRGAESRRS